jgi:hypothetical protein
VVGVRGERPRRDLTPRVSLYFGAMLGVAAIALATATITFVRHRRMARLAAAKADVEASAT